ncbi:hypothetical protein GCM10025786_33330 [Nocardioides caeni]
MSGTGQASDVVPTKGEAMTVQPHHRARPETEEMSGLIFVIGVLALAAVLVLTLT